MNANFSHVGCKLRIFSSDYIGYFLLIYRERRGLAALVDTAMVILPLFTIAGTMNEQSSVDLQCYGDTKHCSFSEVAVLIAGVSVAPDNQGIFFLNIIFRKNV